MKVRMTFVAALPVALLVALVLGAVPAPARAADYDFSDNVPTAQASLGQPIVFRTVFGGGDTAPERVELLLRLDGERAVTVVPAEVTGSAGRWDALATLEGHVPPNTTYLFRFRIRDGGGDVTGPEGRATVADERFAWQTIEGPLVRLHWYEGDEAFARRALDIGEDSIAQASELLGVTESEPVDFFIYASAADMYEALGPGTRENVGGQAHSSIRTMFGLIEPSEINSTWVDTLVAHELTHLVFDSATSNPFRSPPRWLNEGVAVYLSEGYTNAWRSTVEQAARNDGLIPLDGLGGLFPTTGNEFRLAYGESVSAVDFFVSTHGEPTLWQLVRSYAEGVSDDDAFLAATGADLAAFNAAWMDSLGVQVPEPIGPRPAPPGPLPPDWQVEPQPTTAPGPGGPAVPPTEPGPTAAPGTPGVPAGEAAARQAVLLLIGAVIVVLALVLLVLLMRARQARNRPPPPPTWR